MYRYYVEVYIPNRRGGFKQMPGSYQYTLPQAQTFAKAHTHIGGFAKVLDLHTGITETYQDDGSYRIVR